MGQCMEPGTEFCVVVVPGRLLRNAGRRRPDLLVILGKLTLMLRHKLFCRELLDVCNGCSFDSGQSIFAPCLAKFRAAPRKRVRRFGICGADNTPSERSRVLTLV